MDLISPESQNKTAEEVQERGARLPLKVGQADQVAAGGEW